MLIDQFTEEQIAQIRRELREIQKLSKVSLNYEISAEVEKLFELGQVFINLQMRVILLLLCVE